MWNKVNCMIVWTLFGIALLWDWNENWPFPVLCPLLSFPNLQASECSTLTLSSFRIWKGSPEIPSSLLALFLVMLPKIHLTSYSRMSSTRWMTTSLWLSRSLRPFLYGSSVYSCHLFLICFASHSSLLFLSFNMPILAWNAPLIFPIFLRDL